MSKPLRLSYVTVALLHMAAAAVDRLEDVMPSSGVDPGPLPALAEAISDAVGALADAGGVDSDDGRTVTAGETRLILDSLVVGLDHAAALIPADLVTLPVPLWSFAVLSGVGALLARADGPVGVIAAALRALADATRDGVVDAPELVAVIAAIRAAADAAIADAA